MVGVAALLLFAILRSSVKTYHTRLVSSSDLKESDGSRARDLLTFGFP